MSVFVRGTPRSRSIAVIATALLLPGLLRAQRGAASAGLKPAPADPPPRPVCSAVKPPTAPTDEQRQQARELAQRGQQAAIIGDSPTALLALRNASALDPTDPDLAYHLARAYETAKDAPNAAREYCRFLALSPTAQEADEILEKVRLLAPPHVDSAVASALAGFRSGVASFEHGRLTDADSAFTQAIAFDSTWADAYYNRGYVREAGGNHAAARADFANYLRFSPGASDRAAVANRIAAMSSAPGLSSFRALAFGVVIPGAGEFYTHRPIRGLLTMAAVGGAIAYGLQQKSSTIPVQIAATDPFGQPYSYPSSRVTSQRPNVVVGAITAGGIAAVSALDAAIFAHFSSAEAARVGVSFTPGPATAVARVSLFVR